MPGMSLTAMVTALLRAGRSGTMGAYDSAEAATTVASIVWGLLNGKTRAQN